MASDSSKLIYLNVSPLKPTINSTRQTFVNDSFIEVFLQTFVLYGVCVCACAHECMYVCTFIYMYVIIYVLIADGM